MNDIWQMTASDLAASIRKRRISAHEAATAMLNRMDAVNPSINAVVQCRPDEVLERAAALDKALADGQDPGPLAGVPITVKVNIDQAGFATTNGVRAQERLIAHTNSPVVDALLGAGAVILGRTNTPTLSLRWFTDNQIHGKTWNPRHRGLTPGGSSGGAAAAVAAGIGPIAHGTDIAGSVRYPAYACGLHGLRPSLGRVAAHNETTGDRPIGAQLTAVSGPIARSIADLRLALAVMSRPDIPGMRDPWWVPAPLDGQSMPKRAALCLAPDGLEVDPAVIAALQDAAARLRDAGWEVHEIDDTPPLAEAAQLQIKLWVGDSFARMLATAEADGDPGAITALRGQAAHVHGLDLAEYSAVLLRRATLIRAWQQFFERHAVLLLPVSAEPPFPDALDLQGEAAYARVWRAQMPQIALPFIGMPGLTVTTGTVGKAGAEANIPIGVQLVAARFREDLCLAAGEAIADRGAPVVPVDPDPGG